MKQQLCSKLPWTNNNLIIDNFFDNQVTGFFIKAAEFSLKEFKFYNSAVLTTFP